MGILDFGKSAGVIALVIAATLALGSASGLAQVTNTDRAAPDSAIQAPASLAPIPIALLVEMDSGQTLFARDADRRFIPASITKIMSAYVAFEMIEGGELALDTEFAMSEAAHEDWYRTGSTMFLEQDQPVAVETLLRGITSVSANDASIVLAEGAAGSVDAWLARMNETARALGMRNSHFGTPNGWPDGGRTFTTARDLEKLSRALISRHPEKFARFFGQPGFSFNGFAQANRDPITGRVAGADGIKTGYTRQAGNGFVGTAERDGRRLLMVLGAVDDQEDRNRAARELVEWGFAEFGRSAIFAQGDAIGSARVQDGAEDRVALIAARDIALSKRASEDAAIELKVRYEGPLRAPIAAGEQVAQLEISIDGQPSFRVPLAAAEDVDQASPWQRLLNGFAGIFG